MSDFPTSSFFPTAVPNQSGLRSRLFTVPCGIQSKWPSGRRTPLYMYPIFWFYNLFCTWKINFNSGLNTILQKQNVQIQQKQNIINNQRDKIHKVSDVKSNAPQKDLKLLVLNSPIGGDFISFWDAWWLWTGSLTSVTWVWLM